GTATGAEPAPGGDAPRPVSAALETPGEAARDASVTSAHDFAMLGIGGPALVVDVAGQAADLKRLVAVLRRFPGGAHVVVRVRTPDGIATILGGEQFRVAPEPPLMRALAA